MSQSIQILGFQNGNVNLLTELGSDVLSVPVSWALAEGERGEYNLTDAQVRELTSYNEYPNWRPNVTALLYSGTIPQPPYDE